MRYRSLIWIGLFLLQAPNLAAQNDLRFRQLTAADGLSSNNIRTLQQDKYGFIWIGTDEGLNRYDGYQFKIFRSLENDTTTLSNDYINDILVDHNGEIWVATATGLNHYQYESGLFERYFDRENDSAFLHNKNTFYRLTEDDHHRILAATATGVLCIDSTRTTFQLLTGNDERLRKVLSSGVSMVAYDNNLYWISSEKGLGLFGCNINENDNSLSVVYVADSTERIYSDLLPTDHNYFLSANDIGLFLMDYRHQKNYPVFDRDPKISKISSGASRIIRLHDGTVMIGLLYSDNDHNGIAIYHPQDTTMWVQQFNNHDATGIIWGYINAMIETKDHLVWIATSRGISILDPAKQEIEWYAQFPEDHFNQHDNLYSFGRVGNKIVMGSDGGGTYLFDPATHQFEPLHVNEENNLRLVYGLLEINDHSFYAGTQSAGVFLVDLQNHTSKLLIPPTNFSPGFPESAGSMAMTDPEHLWVGWMGAGLSCLNIKTGELRRIRYDKNDPDGISSDQVSSILYDGKKYLWIGYSEGINTFRPGLGTGVDRMDLITGEVKHYKHKENDPSSLSNNNVTSMAMDAGGNIWIGTRAGLNKIDPVNDNITVWHISDGLPFEYIAALEIDDAGNVWIASWVNGLAMLNTKTNRIRAFDQNDGLQNLRFNRGSSFKDVDGSLYFGGISGFNHIIPGNISQRNIIAPIYFSAIKVNGKNWSDSVPVYDRKNIALAYSQSDIQIDFTALAYSDQDKIEYYYRLTGYSDEWKKTGERSANYTNLDPGDYTFEVKVVNKITGQMVDTRTLGITIATPFWMTGWFRFIMVLLLTAGVILVIRMRTAVLRGQKLELENTVKDRTRELVIAKDRAEQSEQFKQQFLANMSHEIRTPMNAVSGMTELLIDKQHLPEQEKYLTAIQKSADTLLHIINDILDISKVEAGKLDLEEIDFSLSDVVKQVMQTLQIKADEKGLQWTSQISHKVPDVLIGDPHRLKQILINLCGNAIKFTDKGSVQLKVDFTVTEQVQFQVIDTGIGIPSDKLETVFESFRQAQSSDTRKYGGTGLGLSISKQLIELQGGSIRVDSEMGSGTTFTCVIPFKKGTTENQTTSSSGINAIHAASLNGLRILLVDDNEYNRIVATDTLLSRCSLDITQAENGLQAIEQLERSDFDLVLMDVQMPLMNGFEATQYIRARFAAPKNKIPVLALTASVLRTDLDKCKQAGMNGYVPKPFKAHQLFSAIAEVTGRNITIRPVKEEPTRKYAAIERITDLTFLNQFTEGDVAARKKYINIYLEKTNLHLERLQTAMTETDFETMGIVVHTMKAHFKMMGMQSTLQKAIEIEAALEENEKGKLQTLFEKFVEMCEWSMRELEEV